MGEILTRLSLLMPAFSLLYNPQLLPIVLQLVQNAPLPITVSCKHDTYNPTASVIDFSPGNLRRRSTRPVSYYALFKSMAASKPTSWLSV